MEPYPLFPQILRNKNAEYLRISGGRGWAILRDHDKDDEPRFKRVFADVVGDR